MKPKTYVILLLDKSGSMGQYPEKKMKTISDFNEKVQMYKDVHEEGEQEVLVCLVTFNHHADEHLWCQSADELVELTEQTYLPTGGTALNDAVAYVLSKAKETIQLGENDAGMIVIMTDGDENSSQKYPGVNGNPIVNEMSQSIQEVKNSEGKQQWTVSWMGVSKREVEKAAKNFSIPVANCAVLKDTNASALGAGYRATRTRQKQYFTSRSAGVVPSAVNFYSDSAEMLDCTNLTEEDDKTAGNIGAQSATPSSIERIKAQAKQADKDLKG